jgi:hypothetical protein
LTNEHFTKLKKHSWDTQNKINNPTFIRDTEDYFECFEKVPKSGEHSSGTSIKGKNRVHKMANKELKRMLHMCALTSIKYIPEFKDYFNRKKAEGKNGMLPDFVTGTPIFQG